jgi:hypothetical protein
MEFPVRNNEEFIKSDSTESIQNNSLHNHSPRTVHPIENIVNDLRGEVPTKSQLENRIIKNLFFPEQSVAKEYDFEESLSEESVDTYSTTSANDYIENIIEMEEYNGFRVHIVPEAGSLITALGKSNFNQCPSNILVGRYFCTAN